jgi:hypothetical protein
MRKRSELHTIGTLAGIVCAADLDNAVVAPEPGAVDPAFCALRARLPTSISFVCQERWVEGSQRWRGELTAFAVVNRPSREALAAAEALARIAMRPPPSAAIRLLADAICRAKLLLESGAQCRRRAG